MTEELKTYRGNCHCAAYIYEVKLPEITSLTECNCSMCYKRGGLWALPKPGNFRFVKGDPETLTNYSFAQKSFSHKFCPNCGIQVLVVGFVEPPKPGEETEPLTGVNVRTFQHGQGVDVWTIEKTLLDGRSWPPAYKPPKFTGAEPKAEIEGGRLYTGSCHCGAVRIALKSKPLDKTFTDRISECNCSICGRTGSVWIYPAKEQVVTEGEENLAVYLSGTRLFGKSFCTTCGIQVHNLMQPVSEEDIENMPQGQADFIRSSFPIQPINLRVFNDVDVHDLNVQQFDGYNIIEPRYVEP
ncbi:glutathione-dependent formaldehyde-activating enzyme [Durotheca rogersii]|uniref:glutathione-dependent formaldehyde-activating enzyme n=1 Tax=Durotheca rogersii TaxID=419775 RepID=UPI00221FE6D0|nr:glutathione-dependent formaldehyde-activating enzyme [Durotheca rogersii]KAI5868532.1 glutathione-dependent formaldehyde-activating enzyme [Durotheca rogersii]